MYTKHGIMSLITLALLLSAILIWDTVSAMLNKKKPVPTIWYLNYLLHNTFTLVRSVSRRTRTQFSTKYIYYYTNFNLFVLTFQQCLLSSSGQLLLTPNTHTQLKISSNLCFIFVFRGKIYKNRINPCEVSN